MSKVWIVIAGMALVTAVPRVAPILLLSGRKMPKIVEKWLSFIVPAILSALLLPQLLIGPGQPPALSFFNPALLATFPTFLVAWWTKSLSGTVAAGVVAMALLRFLGLN